jgi:hypothetical protein
MRNEKLIRIEGGGIDEYVSEREEEEIFCEIDIPTRTSQTQMLSKQIQHV